MPSFPKSAADLQTWLNTIIDAVTACARKSVLAFDWIAHVEHDDVQLAELGAIDEEFEPLDAKLCSGFTKHKVDEHAHKHKQLIEVIVSRSEEMKRSTPRSQIKSRQIVLLVRHSYEVRKDKRI